MIGAGASWRAEVGLLFFTPPFLVLELTAVTGGLAAFAHMNRWAIRWFAQALVVVPAIVAIGWLVSLGRSQ
jgi:hypothetical protein